MTKHHLTRNLALALGASALALLIACGGDDSTSAEGATGDAMTEDTLVDAEGPPNLSEEALRELGLDGLDPASLEEAVEALGLDMSDLTEGAGAGDSAEAPDADDDGGSSGGDAAACELAAEEIAELVGPPAEAAPPKSAGLPGDSCEWKGQPGQYGTPRTLVVTVWPGARYFREGDDVDPGAESIDLGDEGWVSEQGGLVMWRDGDRVVDVHAPLSGLSADELVAVARAVDRDLS